MPNVSTAVHVATSSQPASYCTTPHLARTPSLRSGVWAAALLELRRGARSVHRPRHRTAPVQLLFSPRGACGQQSLAGAYLLSPACDALTRPGGLQVHIDEEQLRWFEGELERAEGRPVIVFSHAPILGSGLRVSSSGAQGVGGPLPVGSRVFQEVGQGSGSPRAACREVALPMGCTAR